MATRGRPPIGDAAATSRITFRVTPAQAADLRRVALDNRTAVAGVVRDAVNEFVADYGERRTFVRRK